MPSETGSGIARRFFDAVEAGDVDAVAAMYHPDAVIWHNDDGREVTRDENLRALRGLVRYTTERRYADRRVHEIDGGFVQQHVLHATRADGVELELPACLVVTLDDGLIVRLDEYYDSTAIGSWLPARS